jgi:hypothetical protein
VFVPCCLQTRRRACVSADDEQQLLEVQAELLSDFLAEIPSLQHSRLRSLLSPPMDDSIQDNNDTSLQFAWDTIHEQKKEIIRLRAENDELKRQGDERAAKMSQSLFSDDKKPRAQSIDLLRSQISSHHDNNVSMLHEHIHNLEKALHRATSSATSVSKDKRRGPRFDASSSTVNSSRDNDGATDFSRSALHLSYSSRASSSTVDFSRTAVTPLTRSCEQCHRKSISILTLEAEARQLRAQLEADEHALLSAEKDQTALRSENAAMSAAVVSAKKQQQELRELVFELRVEKKQLQQVMDSYRHASETTSRHLTAHIADLEAQIRGDSSRLKHSSFDGDGSSSSKEWDALPTAYQERLTTLENMIQTMQADVRKRDALIREMDEKSSQSKTVTPEKMNDARLPSSVSMGRADNQLKKLDGELADAHQRIEELSAGNKELKRVITKLENDMESREDHGLQLERRLDRVKKSSAELETSLQEEQENAARVHRELEKAQKKVTSLTLELHAVQEERSQLTSRVDALNDNLSTELIRLKSAKEDATAAKHELGKVQTSCDDVLVKSKEELQQSAKQIERLQHENIQLTQEIADTKTTVLMWMSKHNSIEESKANLEQELASASEENYALKQRFEESTRCHDNAINSLRAELEEKFQLDVNEAIREVNDQLSTANESVAVDYRSRVAQMETQNASLKNQVEKLESSISSLRAADEKRKKTLVLVESASQQLNDEVRTGKIEKQKLQQQLVSSDRERATLKLLVETLEARPQLQKRALVEMISRCCRELESTSFLHIFERLQVLSDRIESAQQQQGDLQRELSSKRRISSSTTVACHDIHNEQADAVKDISISDLAHSTSPGVGLVFDASGSGWFQPVSPTKPSRSEPIDSIAWNQRRELMLERWQSFTGSLVRDQRAATVIGAFKTAAAEWKQEAARWKRASTTWKWRYATRAVLAAVLSKRVQTAQRHATGQTLDICRLRASVVQLQWRVLRVQCEATATKKQNQASEAQVTHSKRGLVAFQLRIHFHAWRYAIELRKMMIHLEESEAERRSLSAAFTPETVMALGNCIYLLQRFCDDGGGEGNQGRDQPRLKHQDLLVGKRHLPSFTRESLIVMLKGSNHKIARWQVVLDKKLTELSSSKKHLCKLKTRCDELNSLVGLNQRLIGEMERRVAARQSIVEAAWDVTASFRRLPASSPVKAEAGDFGDLAVACNTLTDALHSFRVSRRVSGTGAAADHTKSLVQPARSGVGSIVKRVTFAASTAQPDASGSLQEQSLEATQRVEFNALNITILEDAISSLQSVSKNREALEKALADANRSLITTHRALKLRNHQFHVLRAFIQWKSVTLLLRLRAQEHSH